MQAGVSIESWFTVMCAFLYAGIGSMDKICRLLHVCRHVCVCSTINYVY